MSVSRFVFENWEEDDWVSGRKERVTLSNGREVEVHIHGHRIKFVDSGEWKSFLTPVEMFKWLAQRTNEERWYVAFKASQTPSVPEIPLEKKRQFVVWEDEHWMILKLPPDPDFIQREGVDMQHCLAHRGTAEHYCASMASGEQDQYSLVDKADGKPYVNFEVALTRSSYGGRVGSKCLTQIRGRRNQCPPADRFIPVLASFFKLHPEWTVGSHSVRSFDNGVDGDKFIARAQQLGVW